MWPFSARKPRLDVFEIKRKQDKNFDFPAYAKNDAYIKLWLSERITLALDNLSLQHEVSRPDVLRWILFEHVYGRDLFVGLLKYKSEQDDDDTLYAQFSRKEIPQTERFINHQFLGKATENIKFWLPNPLKEDLIKLADQGKKPLSNYLREILVFHLFGQLFFHQWQEALNALNIEANSKEKDNLRGNS